MSWLVNKLWGKGDAKEEKAAAGQDEEEEDEEELPSPPPKRQAPAKGSVATPSPARPSGQSAPQSPPGAGGEGGMSEGAFVAMVQKVRVELQGQYTVEAAAVVEVAHLDLRTGVWNTTAKKDNTIAIIAADAKNKYTYCLMLYPNGKQTMRVPLVRALNISHDGIAAQMSFNFRVVEVETFRLTFFSIDQEIPFRRKVAEAIFENERKEQFEKALKSEKDRDFVYSAEMDTNMDVDEEDMEQKQQDMEFGGTYDAKFDAEEDEEPEDTKSAYSTPAKQLGGGGRTHNSNLAVGMLENRTFVSRGHRIGVFAHDEGGNLKYITKIPEVKDLKGNVFSPSKTMLHQGDTKLLLLDEHAPDRVFCMDLEKQKVVAEWSDPQRELQIRNLAPRDKYAERTGEQTFLGVNKNSVFCLDPRAKDILARHQTYAQPPKLSCVMTTEQGQAVVGSEKGELRLFSDVDKRAKSLLPGLGDPIVGVDVTGDGKFVLATTSKYLLVVKTVMDDGKTGFQKAFAKDEKPQPLKLQLRPQDIAKYRIDQVNFTAAHFDIGEDIREHWIVTSTGPFIIVWDFNKVKRGDRFAYKITEQSAEVVADQFRFGQTDQVVYMAPEDIGVKRITKK